MFGTMFKTEIPRPSNVHTATYSRVTTIHDNLQLVKEMREKAEARRDAVAHRGVELEQFLQRFLLMNGHAEAYRVNPNTHFSSVFEADERDAIEKQRGLWGACL